MGPASSTSLVRQARSRRWKHLGPHSSLRANQMPVFLVCTSQDRILARAKAPRNIYLFHELADAGTAFQGIPLMFERLHRQFMPEPFEFELAVQGRVESRIGQLTQFGQLR